MFDPCVPTGVVAPAATAVQQASLERALALWSDAGVDAFVLDGDATITVEFRPAAAAIYGFYDAETATVYVNEGLGDADARAITIAHELGHALALEHVPPSARVSVMNAGNLTVAPAAGDAAELVARWGACSDAAAP